MKYKVFLASKNKGKINEFKDIFKKYKDIELLSMLDGYEFHDVIEDKETFEENSQKKALEIAKVVNMFVIADDSGLEVEALGGKPGVYSARYSGENATDEMNNKKLLEEMKDKKNCNGRYISAITIASPNGEYKTYVGEIKGKILDKEIGDKGFGYDPLFYMEEYKKTFGELDEKIKNKISHRANAMKKLDKEILEFLKVGEDNMKYISTRGNYRKINSAEAIKLGMVPEGGLFVPESIPKLSLEDLKKISEGNYQQISEKILSLFLTDFDSEEISEIIKKSYGENFDTTDVTPLIKIKENLYILELWHGPTAAFKDMALQMLPHLMLKSKEKVGTDKTTLILVATSGDTGKAALEGFKDVEGIEIIVFFPEEGVSKVQELQMRTTTGVNTKVIGINGNFDDCQTGVKNIFSNKELAIELAKKGYELSSANSINWGRLLPQIIYYFKAYFDLINNKKIEIGEKINFSVPTGNFGNILAGYYAKEIGLPINKFICASNKNKVLSDFINTGEYNKNREFYKTMSPSMDILISSNLERFLFEITEHDSKKIDKWYKELNETGKFKIDSETKNKIEKIMIAGFASEIETEKTISKIYSETNYLLDTHTAVGVKVANDFNLQGKMIVDSTANPYKFTSNVLKALNGEEGKDEFDAIDILYKKTKVEIHRAVKGLDEKKILHTKTINKDEMKDVVVEIVG